MVQSSEDKFDTDPSELTRVIQAIRRRLVYVLAFVVLVTVVAIGVGASQEPTYTANAQIVLEPRDDNTINDLVADSLSKDASAIETQIKLLRTYSHIKKVITALNLEKRWTYKIPSENESGQPWVGSFFQSWGSALASLTTGEDDQSNQESAKTNRRTTLSQSKMDALHAHFLKNYRVQQEGQSYVISIYYTSDDPTEAAEVANSVADIFIRTKRTHKLRVTDRTSQWLSKRADTLHQELRDLEQQIFEFREQNPVDNRRLPLADSEVAVLTSELAKVRGELSAKAATLDLARQTVTGKGDLRDIAEINTSVVLQELLAEQTALAAKEAELSKTFGERHPRMVQHQAEQERVNFRIEQETIRIVSSIANDVRILSVRRDSLEQEINKLRRQEVGKANVTFQLEDLLRRGETTRELYRHVLQRSKEINEQQEIVEPDVRMVSQAIVPQAPSSPGAKIYGAIGFCSSSVLSIMFVLFLDRLDKRLRTPGQVRDELGLETAALIPQVGQSNLAPHRRLIDLPRSIYADAMRSVFMAVRQSAINAGPQIGLEEREGQVVLVTSSLPDEGKSTLSLSLATTAALQTKDVIIVDLDLRHPQIHHLTGLKPKSGIAEYCRYSSTDLKDCIVYEEETGLNYLFVKNLPRDPSATISSDRFLLLMERLREQFDLIVIDAAPILAVTETRLLLNHVDLVAFCIRWGKTDTETVIDALGNIWGHDTPPSVLAVLTRVDMEKGAAYGLTSSRHRKVLKKYYQEE